MYIANIGGISENDKCLAFSLLAFSQGLHSLLRQERNTLFIYIDALTYMSAHVLLNLLNEL